MLVYLFNLSKKRRQSTCYNVAVANNELIHTMFIIYTSILVNRGTTTYASHLFTVPATKSDRLFILSDHRQDFLHRIL